MKKPKMTNEQIQTFWYGLHCAKGFKVDRAVSKRERIAKNLKTIRGKNA